MVVPGKLWMTRDQPGVVIPEAPIVHGMTNANKNMKKSSKFAVSFWVRLPKNSNVEDDSSKLENQSNNVDFTKTYNKSWSNTRGYGNIVVGTHDTCNNIQG